MSPAIGGAHEFADMLVAADLPRLSSMETNQNEIPAKLRGAKEREVPVRMPYHRWIPRLWHPQHAYSCAKRCKTCIHRCIFISSTKWLSLPGTAAWQVVWPRLSANGHVVEDAYKPDTNPIQAKLMYARWRANAPSAAWKRCIQYRAPAQPCSLHLASASASLPTRVFNRQQNYHSDEIQGPNLR